MKLKEITDCLETYAPLAYQESYDNAGLICGNKNMDITAALICLDSTEEVIDEAIAKGCNLVIAHHPIVFKGLKKFNGTIKKRRGKSDVLKWQTLYFCQLIKNKWKITGFVGYLPLE